MRIFIAADHAGFELKEKLKKYLGGLGYEIKDFGAFKYDVRDDYPDFIIPAIKSLSEDVRHSVSNSRGIILGGSGIGECIAANKIKGIRAARPWDAASARMSRWHNNANVLCLGGGKTVDKSQNIGLSFAKVKKIASVWLNTPFSGEPRHIRRLKKIEKLI